MVRWDGGGTEPGLGFWVLGGEAQQWLIGERSITGDVTVALIRRPYESIEFGELHGLDSLGAQGKVT